MEDAAEPVAEDERVAEALEPVVVLAVAAERVALSLARAEARPEETDAVADMVELEDEEDEP